MFSPVVPVDPDFFRSGGTAHFRVGATISRGAKPG
jgi:hypothetical protein